MNAIIRVPALVPYLRCPDQRYRHAFVYAESEERFRGTLKCVRASCRQRWLAEPLNAGSVRLQLETNYEDLTIADDLMVRLRLPESIPEPS